jgi:predicted 3-demethylubiquinone-9 3-methyltransferase (glyoxalase superfamily)
MSGMGEHNFDFNEAFSFVVNCKDQNEVDYYWNKLISDGGSESQCAWLKDKFGVSWQIVPTRLIELLGDPDPAKAQKVMMAMLQMKKIIIADLEVAYQNV